MRYIGGKSLLFFFWKYGKLPVGPKGEGYFYLYAVSGENMVHCHLKKGCLIFKNNFWYKYFWHNWPSNVYSLFHLTQCLVCTTWGKQNQRNLSWNEQKYVKNHSQRYRLWLEEGLTDFNNFCCKHFQHYLLLNAYSGSHLTKCLLLHYLGKPKQAK